MTFLIIYYIYIYIILFIENTATHYHYPDFFKENPNLDLPLENVHSHLWLKNRTKTLISECSKF